MQQKTRAFTLIELLVVIALIGILASITIVVLVSQRLIAKTAANQASIRSVVPVMQVCADRSGSINSPQSAGGNQICALADVDDVYPPLVGDWEYEASAVQSGATFYFRACDDGCTPGNTQIECRQTGCDKPTTI